MPVRVELTTEAFNDLWEFHRAGNSRGFLVKLVRLEDVGEEAGQPLARGLHGFRKIVVGDRTWRIIFQMSPDKTVAIVWVIGDRDDAAVYAAAEARLAAFHGQSPEAVSLAKALAAILDRKKR